MALIIILGFAVALFLVSFVTKRRFGVLGLALCAGALLSQHFAGSATGFIEANGVLLLSPPLTIVVSIGLVLLPPILLLFGGPKYQSKRAAVVASLFFAAFATILVLSPLTNGIRLEGTASQVYDFVLQNNAVFVAGGIIVALADMLLVHAPKLGRRHKEH